MCSRDVKAEGGKKKHNISVHFASEYGGKKKKVKCLHKKLGGGQREGRDVCESSPLTVNVQI